MHKLFSILVVATVLPGASCAEDWSGFYGGFSFGTVSGELTFQGRFGPFDTPVDGTQAGAFLGYAWQTGNLTYGAEIAAMSGLVTDDGFTDVGVDRLAALKGRLGYAFGSVQAYGVLGLGWEEYRNVTERKWGNGVVVGLGVEARLGARAFGGVEYLRYQGDMEGETFIPEHDTDLDTVALRIGMRF